MEKAEQECLSDEDQRMARRERDATRRVAQDEALVITMAQSIRRRYPEAPTSKRKKSRAILPSWEVNAWVVQPREGIWKIGDRSCRHGLGSASQNQYDELLGSGRDRFDARQMVKEKIQQVLDRWTGE
jgi:hypothetical protein